MAVNLTPPYFAEDFSRVVHMECGLTHCTGAFHSCLIASCRPPVMQSLEQPLRQTTNAMTLAG